MKGKYLIVELDGGAVPGAALMDMDKLRTFASMEDTKKWMRSDAQDTLNGTEMEIGRMPEWGTPVAICKVVEVCRPVPVVSVRVEIVGCDASASGKDGER